MLHVVLEMEDYFAKVGFVGCKCPSSDIQSASGRISENFEATSQPPNKYLTPVESALYLHAVKCALKNGPKVIDTKGHSNWTIRNPQNLF